MINSFSFCNVSRRVFSEQQGQVESSLTMRNISRTNRRMCSYNLNLKSADLYPPACYLLPLLTLESALELGSVNYSLCKRFK